MHSSFDEVDNLAYFKEWREGFCVTFYIKGLVAMDLPGIKTACIVQGDIRRGTKETLAALEGHFDELILSTWKSDEAKVPSGEFKVLLNDVPPCKGQVHRNFQRVGVNAGLKLAQELGCNYVLKWRTDMLPTKLDVDMLLEMSQYNVPENVQSRIVLCDFRNMSADPDWYSSVPDFFAFAHIDVMNMFWGADGFDFKLPINPPIEMKKDLDIEWFYDDVERGGALFPPESELYSHFKSRLAKKTSLDLNHIKIARDYLYLVDYRKFGICWFGADVGFRPIGVTYRYPWWTESVWRGSKAFVISKFTKKYMWQGKTAYKLRKFSKKRSHLEQQMWLDAYQGKKSNLIKSIFVGLKYFWLNIMTTCYMKLWRTLQVITKP